MKSEALLETQAFGAEPAHSPASDLLETQILPVSEAHTNGHGDGSETIASTPPDWTGPGNSTGTTTGSLKPGSLLGGRFKIIRALGEGGMGAVYQAWDGEVDRVVAIKVIRPELADNPEILRRFKQELILARQTTHRNVVRIHDLVIADGIKFISMEYIDGRDVSSLLEEKTRLAPDQAAESCCRYAGDCRRLTRRALCTAI